MQDRFAGDLGDFLKLGFLRWLVPVGTPAFPRLGVVWYRTASETHNADGKYVAYLDPAHRSSALCGDSTRTCTNGSSAWSPPRIEAWLRWLAQAY